MCCGTKVLYLCLLSGSFLSASLVLYCPGTRIDIDSIDLSPHKHCSLWARTTIAELGPWSQVRYSTREHRTSTVHVQYVEWTIAANGTWFLIGKGAVAGLGAIKREGGGSGA